jgi:hypothetical protein
MRRSKILMFLDVIAALMLSAFIAYWTAEIVFQRAAHGASCLTKHEARERWPRRHIFWHSSDHCWDTHRGGRRHFASRLAERSRAEDDDDEKPKPVQPQRFAQQKPLTPWIIYPSVANPHSKIDREFLKGVESTYTYRILDIDEITAKKSDPLEECCWPELVRDKRGNVVGIK